MKKPILPAGRARAPQRAPRRGDINAHAGAVAEHGNVRQPSDQLGVDDFASSVGQIITMKARLRLSDALQEVWADKRNRFHLDQLDCNRSVGAGCLHVTHRANPSTQATCETAGCHWRERVAILRPLRASTTLCRRLVQIDNDKVAPECNEAARRERDCSRLARACRDRCGEVSRQNEASTDTPPVKPWLRTRSANRSWVDKAQRRAGVDLGRPVWPRIRIPSIACRR